MPIDILLHFDDLKPKRMTMPRPQQLEDFYKLSKYEQENQSSKFFSQDFIKDYLDKKWEVELYNRTNYEWCKTLLIDLLYKYDMVNRKKVAERMYEFKTAIQKTEHPFKALQIDWSKEATFDEVQSIDKWDDE